MNNRDEISRLLRGSNTDPSVLDLFNGVSIPDINPMAWAQTAGNALLYIPGKTFSVILDLPRAVSSGAASYAAAAVTVSIVGKIFEKICVGGTYILGNGIETLVIQKISGLSDNIGSFASSILSVSAPTKFIYSIGSTTFNFVGEGLANWVIRPIPTGLQKGASWLDGTDPWAIRGAGLLTHFFAGYYAFSGACKGIYASHQSREQSLQPVNVRKTIESLRTTTEALAFTRRIAAVFTIGLVAATALSYIVDPGNVTPWLFDAAPSSAALQSIYLISTYWLAEKWITWMGSGMRVCPTNDLMNAYGTSFQAVVEAGELTGHWTKDERTIYSFESPVKLKLDVDNSSDYGKFAEACLAIDTAKTTAEEAKQAHEEQVRLKNKNREDRQTDANALALIDDIEGNAKARGDLEAKIKEYNREHHGDENPYAAQTGGLVQAVTEALAAKNAADAEVLRLEGIINGGKDTHQAQYVKELSALQQQENRRLAINAFHTNTHIKEQMRLKLAMAWIVHITENNKDSFFNQAVTAENEELKGDELLLFRKVQQWLFKAPPKTKLSIERQLLSCTNPGAPEAAANLAPVAVNLTKEQVLKWLWVWGSRVNNDGTAQAQLDNAMKLIG